MVMRLLSSRGPSAVIANASVIDMFMDTAPGLYCVYFNFFDYFNFFNFFSPCCLLIISL
jgi:hypothetical protein